MSSFFSTQRINKNYTFRGLLSLLVAMLVFAVGALEPNGSWEVKAAPPEWAPAKGKPESAPDSLPGEVLVKFRRGISKQKKENIHSQAGTRLIKAIKAIEVHRVKGRRGQSTEVLLELYRRLPQVEYVEPNYVVKTNLLPNDAYYPELWGLKNSGQVYRQGIAPGTVGVDLDVETAWDISTGNSSIIVAVIDTGVDANHTDLAANMWSNPAEIAANGVDDDGNGYIDDVAGWDFLANDTNPHDENGHGTHVAGTIAATGNNSEGVIGVAFQSRIMPLRFLDATGSGNSSDGAEALIYAADNGARIANNSWGGGYSLVIEDAIAYADSKGMLVVSAAGNDSYNRDYFPSSPCSSKHSNVLCVAAHGSSGSMAYFTAFGPHSVHVIAPGVDILSTVPTGNCELCTSGGYHYLRGTSMASPHAAGVAALAVDRYPTLNPQQIKWLLTNSNDLDPANSHPTSYFISDGRLNASQSLIQPFVMHVQEEGKSFPIGQNTTSYTLLVDSLADNYSDTLQLALGSLPDGISASLDTTSVSVTAGTTATATVTVTTADTVGRGDYYFDVYATDSTGKKHKAQMRLSLTGPDFTLSATPSYNQVLQGTTSAQYFVKLTSYEGYVPTQPVELSFSSTEPSITGSFSVNPVTLTANGTVTSRLTLQIPATLGVGEYPITIRAFDGVRMRERNVLFVSNDSDLVVTAVEAPTEVYAGDAFIIRGTVKNLGTVGYTPESSLSFTISQDQVPGGDYQIGMGAVPPLGPGESYDFAVEVSTQQHTSEGPYYFGVEVDYSETVNETDETNNWLFTSTPTQIWRGAELVISQVSAPTQATTGTQITVSDTVTNSGVRSTGFGFTVGYYLSTDAVITRDDTLLGERGVSALEAGQSNSGSLVVSIPNLPAGTYYIGALADSGNSVPESDELNNALAASNTTQLGYGPDYVVNSATLPAQLLRGTTAQINYTLGNIGESSIGSSLLLSIYLSSDNVIDASDTRIGYLIAPEPAAGGTSSGTATVNIPADHLLGSYYVSLIVDPDNYYGEKNENNNTLVAGTSTVVASVDLVVSNFTAPAEIALSQYATSFSVSDTVTNQGNGTSTQTILGYYLSTDAVITKDDIYLGSHTVYGIDPGASRATSQTLVLPSGTLPGSYYIGALVDPLDSVSETDETNNASTALALEILGPDLVVSGLTAPPASAIPGGSFDATATLLNQGTGSGRNVGVRFFLSSDPNYDAGDTAIGIAFQNVELVPGASLSLTDTLTIPTSMTPGTYYLLAYADPDNSMIEIDENNNVISAATTLVISSKPIIESHSVTTITDTTATITAQINPAGLPTQAWVEWGINTSLGNSTAAQSLGSGTEPVTFIDTITGLQAGTTYYYRVHATNSLGNNFAILQTFTTAAPPPVVNTLASTSTAPDAVELLGTVDNNGFVTDAWFEYGSDANYGSTSPVTRITSTGVQNLSYTVTNLLPGTMVYYRMVAQNVGGIEYGPGMSHTTAIPAPTASTQAVTELTRTSVILNGTANAYNGSGSAWFEYKLSSATAYTATASVPVSGMDAVTVSTPITSLTTNTSYDYRLVVQTQSGTVYSPVTSFTTLPLSPVVTTGAASSIGVNAATVTATVNAQEANTSFWFEYGTTTAYGSSTTPVVLTGTGDQPLSQVLAGLTSGTTYHYRVVGQNAGGISYGNDMTLTTAFPTPSATTQAPTEVTRTSVVLHGQANVFNNTGSAWFEYRLSSSGSYTATASVPVSGAEPVSLSAPISGLSVNTTYSYRLVVQTPAETVYSAEATLTTLPEAPLVTTDPVSSVRNDGGTLNATVNAQGANTNFWFEYGTTTAFGSSTASVLRNASTDETLSQTLTDLASGTVYYYRVVGENAGGISYGAAQSFKTKGKAK